MTKNIKKSTKIIQLLIYIWKTQWHEIRLNEIKAEHIVKQWFGNTPTPNKEHLSERQRKNERLPVGFDFDFESLDVTAVRSSVALAVPLP